MKKQTIGLGDRVKDAVSGFVGIVTGRYEYLNGCVRIGVSPPADKDGKVPDTMIFDDHQLEVVEVGAVKPKFASPIREMDKGEPEPIAPVAADARDGRRTGGPRDTVDHTRDRC